MTRLTGGWQRRAFDLLLLISAVGLAVVVTPLIAPHVLAGSVGGTSHTSFVIVVLGAILAVGSCRYVIKAPASVEQIVGAFLFAAAGYAARSIIPFPAPPGYGTMYVLVCVYLFGLAGAVLGGFVVSLLDKAIAKAHDKSTPPRARALYAAPICLSLAAAVVVAIAVSERDAAWYAPALLILIGSFVGAASGMISLTHSSVRWRLLGGAVLSALVFYFATLVLQFSGIPYDGLFRALSVCFAGLVGGVGAAFIHRTATRVALTVGVAPRLMLILMLAPLAVLFGFVAYRLVATPHEAAVIAGMRRSGLMIFYAEDRKNLAQRRRGPVSSAKPSVRRGVLKALGFSAPKGLGFCKLGSEYIPVEIDPGYVDEVERFLPEISHMSIHTSHLENQQFVSLLNAAELPKLRSLQIHGTRLDGTLLSRLPPTPSLELLFLNGTGVKSLTEEECKNFQGLRVLDLSETAADDLLVERLTGLSAIEALSLRDTAITDASAMHLAAMGKLQHLDVRRTALTDRAIESITKMANLRRLDLRETLITNAGTSRIRASLRNCDIAATLQLGESVAGQVGSTIAHQWSFRAEASTLLRIIPSSENNKFRFAVSPTFELGLPMVALPPDWFGFRLLSHTPHFEGSKVRLINFDPEMHKFLFLPRQSSYEIAVRSPSSASSYEFKLVPVNHAATDITERLGETIVTRLRTGGDSEVFRLGGAPGTRLRFDAFVDEHHVRGRVQMVNSYGGLLFDVPLGKKSQECVLDSHPPFYLLIAGTDGEASHVEVGFRVAVLPSESAETTGTGN